MFIKNPCNVKKNRKSKKCHISVTKKDILKSSNGFELLGLKAIISYVNVHENQRIFFRGR